MGETQILFFEVTPRTVHGSNKRAIPPPAHKIPTSDVFFIEHNPKNETMIISLIKNTCVDHHPLPSYNEKRPGKMDSPGQSIRERTTPMLGPSANPAMIVGVITAFFLLTGYLSYLMGKKDSGSGHKGASF
jgi:hypothetical protein